jgi:hypothetical protein
LTSQRTAILLGFLFFIAASAGCASGGHPGDAWSDSDVFDVTPDADPDDTDGDGITDEREGRYDAGGAADTDGDGTPDYLDGDSDDDGIPDSVEAGSAASLLGPVDSDGDGTPDFRDVDSDDNGIPDEDEGAEDTDGDGIGDYADPDNDGDTLTDEEEIGGDPDHPVDTDRDHTPDYMDIDSDNDLIADIQEARGDTDRDGTPDRLDMDSDGDTVTDSYEAGDGFYDTWPEDTDEDGFPNFRDVDSDSDGLKDGWEVNHDLNPYSEDTDHDGFDDLTEIGAGSDTRDPLSTPRTVGNFYFLIDYMEDPVPPEDDLVFRTDIRYADIFFLMDTTGSMGGEIDRLKVTLSTTIIPGIAGVIEDVRYGLGAFDDYPVSPYGGEPPTYDDAVFHLHQAMTADGAEIQAAVDLLETHFGGDCPESQVPALFTTATGTGFLPDYLEPQLGCDVDAGEFGYPCFRRRAVPVVIMVTDAPFHNGPGSSNTYSGITPTPVSYDTAVSALRARHVRVISIVSGGGCSSDQAREHADRLARDTGAVDSGGDPLVFTVTETGMGLGSEVVRAVQTLTGNVPVDITVQSRDDPADAVNALQFIRDIVPLQEGGVADPADPTAVCEGGLAVEDADGDTVLDSFTDVIPGTVVCFHLRVNRNESIEPTEEPRTFKAFLDIRAYGDALLDARVVIFMVPPHIEGPGVLE